MLGKQVIFSFTYKMPSRRDRALLAAASTYILLSERKRRYWVRPSLQSKKVYSLTDLLTDLRADDTDPITGEINESGYFRLSGEDKLLLQYNYILLLFWDIGITFDILHGISC